MHDPQSLHKYLYVHGDPIQGVDPTGKFYTAVGALVSSSVRTVMNNRGVATGLIVLDRVSTVHDAVKVIGALAAGGPVSPGLLAGLLLSIVPFGKLFAKAKLVFNGVGDAVSFLSRGGSGHLDEAADVLTEAYKGIKSTSGLASKRLVQKAGDLGAVAVAKKLGLEPVMDFPIRYHGIDGLYKHGDSFVIVEAKGFTRGASNGALSRGQMSQDWINKQIRTLRRRGYTDWARKLDAAVNANPSKIKGMVVKTGVDGDEVVSTTFELKHWADIGPTDF